MTESTLAPDNIITNDQVNQPEMVSARPRTSVSVRVQQVELISRWLSQGYDRKALREGLAERGWSYSEPTLSKLVKLANRLSVRAIRSREVNRLNHAAARRDELFRLAMAAGDYSTAQRIEADRCKLLGLYPSEKREVTQTVTVNHNIAVELFAQVSRYEDEFRLAARAENIESARATVEDQLAGGIPITSHTRNLTPAELAGEAVQTERIETADDEPQLSSE